MRTGMSRAAQCVAVVVGLGFALAGCAEDRASQKRIQARVDHFNRTAESIIRREESWQRRVDFRLRDIDRWWKSDVARTRENIEVLGDYVY
ncbi:MAG: hypothetical protein KF841_11960 [Phycisphaerae bacterium]|nr:hypothetical protein [Phycisphaerae bacterium]